VYLVKKFFVLLCVLVLFAGFAAADDIGLSVGADFGVDDINEPDGAEMGPWADAWIGYDASFGDLDFHTDLQYDFTFTKDDDVYPQDLALNLTLTYNLGLGSASKLTLELAHDATYTLSPSKPSDSNLFDGTFTPRVRFTQKFDFGSIYAQATAPIHYMDELDKDADPTVNLRSRLGWTSTFGLGLWAQVYSKLAPTSDLYNGLGVNVSYGTDAFDFSVFTRIYKELSDGIDISPEFDYYLGNFTFIVACDFNGVAAESGSISINPSLGVSFSF